MFKNKIEIHKKLSPPEAEELAKSHTLKIAICVSGETRMFRDPEIAPETFEKDLYAFKKILNDLGHEVDLYGHTWKHCNTTHINGNDFKRIKVQDQAVIDHWIKKNIFLRSPLILEQTLNPMHADDDGFIEEHVKNGRRTYGQIWSAFEAFDLVTDEDEYDVVVRWRWDLGLWRPNEYNIKQLNYILYKIAHYPGKLGATSGNSDIIPFDYDSRGFNVSFSFTGTIEDVIIFFTNDIVKLTHIDPKEEILDSILRDGLKGTPVDDAHTLWYQYILYGLRIPMDLGVPMMFNLSRTTEK